VLIQPWYDLSATFLSLQVTTKSKTTSAVLRSCEVFWLNKRQKTANSCGTASQVINKLAMLLFTLCFCHCASASTVSQFNLWDSSLCWIQARIFSPILILPLYSDTQNSASWTCLSESCLNIWNKYAMMLAIHDTLSSSYIQAYKESKIAISPWCSKAVLHKHISMAFAKWLLALRNFINTIDYVQQGYGSWLHKT